MNQPGVDLLPNTGSEYYIPKVRKYQQFSFTPPRDDQIFDHPAASW